MRRDSLIIAAIAPVALSMVLAAESALEPAISKETGCWIFPNLRVLPAPGDPACPIRVSDAIRRVEGAAGETAVSDLDSLLAAISTAVDPVRLGVERSGTVVPIELDLETTTRNQRLVRLGAAGLAGALLMAIPISLVLRSTSAAALPLAVFYGAFAGVVVFLVAGRSSDASSVFALMLLTIAPGALLHLAMCFPRESRVVREARAVAALPYVLSLFLSILGFLAVWRTPELWPAFVQVLVAICALAWLVLICACIFAIRESPIPIERERSRLVLMGAALIPMIPALALLLRGDWTPQELPAIYLWSAAGTMPLSIAFAISRYNLFDLGFDSRQGIARLLFLAISAIVLSVGAWTASFAVGGRDSLPGGASLLAASFACALALEPIRTRIPPLLEAVLLPSLRALRAALDATEHALSAVDDEESILRCVESAAVSGIGCRSGSVFVTTGDHPRLVHAFGIDPPSHRALADAAMESLASQRMLHLAATQGSSDATDALRRAGVALVHGIEGGEGRLGIFLLGHPAGRGFYSGIEIDFVRSVASLVGSALFRAHADEVRRTRDQESAAGRLALALAHDTGKDIQWIKLLSQRLAASSADGPRARRDAEMIAELSAELSTAFQRVLDEATSRAPADRELPTLDGIVDRAIRRARNLHGHGSVVDVIDPSVRTVRFPEYLGRALGNLIDNAIRASPRGEPVRVHAMLAAGHIRVMVQDRGRGMPARQRDWAFKAGSTTRGGAGGSGMGLTIASDLARMLGGTVTLESREGAGTTAAILIPAPESTGRDAGSESEGRA